ncbi:response regulator [Sphingomonas sp. BK069]|uniref:response regulator n=1 Tax=Sphingomonas sp. BK069 TaxID=2586979 RepID=UPI001608D166|nr:response regulator [Sphingomonas sp. BK069]MBB3346055.1 CheY-like chemotaxis protein [Sphingomonas sp. BK069]
MTPSTEPYALVVDDDAFILMQARDILENAGFRCHDALEGEEAVRLLEQRFQDVTLLFSDVDLGSGMTGFELARHVDYHWPHIEIVIASGHVLPEKDDMPEKASFIPKPFSERIVLEHLADKLPDGKKPEPLKRYV